MKTLEGMARELFTKYSIKKTGKAGDWKYLSRERKIEWMKEVRAMAKYFLSELHTEIKPLPNNQPSATAYELGYNNGIRAERASILAMVENKYQKLVDELEDFEYSQDK